MIVDCKDRFRSFYQPLHALAAALGGIIEQASLAALCPALCFTLQLQLIISS